MTPGEVPVDDAVWLARSVDKPGELDRQLDDTFRLVCRQLGPDHPRTALAVGAYVVSVADPEAVQSALDLVLERYCESLYCASDGGDFAMERLDDAVCELVHLVRSRLGTDLRRAA